MNMLIDTLPTSLIIDDGEYDINYDFRTSMLFEMLMQDTSIEDNEKLRQALNLYYSIIPENIEEAIEGIIWFYKCGKEDENIKGKGAGKSNTQIYSYDYDDEYIYAAFLDQYGVDLQDSDLHWWKFKAMFKALKEDNEIVKIMGYRAVSLNKIKDKEQKEFYRKMKEIHQIPISQTEQEKLDYIASALKLGKDISEML